MRKLKCAGTARYICLDNQCLLNLCHQSYNCIVPIWQRIWLRISHSKWQESQTLLTNFALRVNKVNVVIRARVNLKRSRCISCCKRVYHWPYIYWVLIMRVNTQATSPSLSNRGTFQTCIVYITLRVKRVDNINTASLHISRLISITTLCLEKIFYSYCTVSVKNVCTVLGFFSSFFFLLPKRGTCVGFLDCCHKNTPACFCSVSGEYSSTFDVVIKHQNRPSPVDINQ